MARDVHDGGMVILCLDYGDRYVGVAVTDLEGQIALRQGVIDQKKEEPMARILELVRKERALKVIVGVPKGMAGQMTEQTQKTLSFMEALRVKLGAKLEVEGVDEVFTSKEARRQLKAEGGRPNDEHMEAARIMLEDYLKMTHSE